jgi:dihydrofolate reductase
MRKITVTEFITLDGVIDEPQQWSFPYWNDEIAKIKLDELMQSSAQLLGRVTYEGFAAAWPAMEDDEAGFGKKMNSMPKFVVSNTLKSADWTNSTIIKGDVAGEISKLKQADGGDIIVAGSANLIKFMMQNNLVDEFTLLVYPLVVGKGQRLFADGIKAPLKLIEERVPGDTGVILQRYAVDKK